jgi:hypothetical protein
MLAFGNDFSRMCQGGNKTGQIRTNAFIMTPTNIPNILTNQAVAYANVVVNHCPPKEDPDQIWITAGGNLITGELSTRTADIMPSKLHWNSILSTQKATYKCLNIKNCHLSVPLDKRYDYMHILIGLFPSWIIE